MIETIELKTQSGLAFTADVAGPAGGDLVLMLHGFPESRHSWRGALPGLAIEVRNMVAVASVSASQDLSGTMPAVGVPVQVVGQGLPAVQAERYAAMLRPDAVIGPCDHGEQVRRDGRGGGQLPAAADSGAVRLAQAVPDDDPVPGCGDGRADNCLHVRLIEGGEDPLGVIQPAVQGQVGLPVGAVGEPVHARSGPRVRHVGLDPQLVAGQQAGHRQPAVVQRGRIHIPPVEHHPAQPGRPELDKTARARYPAAEPDDGDGAEYLLAAGDIKIDVITENVDEPGPLLSLGIRQRTHENSCWHRDPGGPLSPQPSRCPGLPARSAAVRGPETGVAFELRNDANFVPRLLPVRDQF